MANRLIEAPPVPSEPESEAPRVSENGSRETAVLAQWEAGELSTRAAAAQLGLKYYEFLDLLYRKGIPLEGDPFDLSVVQDLSPSTK